jgi:hypothetical protein
MGVHALDGQRVAVVGDGPQTGGASSLVRLLHHGCAGRAHPPIWIRKELNAVPQLLFNIGFRPYQFVLKLII